MEMRWNELGSMIADGVLFLYIAIALALIGGIAILSTVLRTACRSDGEAQNDRRKKYVSPEISAVVLVSGAALLCLPLLIALIV